MDDHIHVRRRLPGTRLHAPPARHPLARAAPTPLARASQDSDHVVVVRSSSPSSDHLRDGRALRLALAGACTCFLVAGAAGALLRFGLLHGLPDGWTAENVRFAHTHLMYFGWVTPALFSLIGSLVRERTGRPLPRAFRYSLAASLLAAASSFVPFLASGYGATTVFGATLPLSMITSALVIATWYAWAIAYVVASWRCVRDLALLALDGALLALLLATTGAWGLALAAFASVAPGALMDALVRFYLDTFSNGWFTFAVVGLLVAASPRGLDDALGRPALALLVVGTLGASLAQLGNGPGWLLLAFRLGAAYALVVLALQLARGAFPVRASHGRAARLLVVALLAGKGLIGGPLALDRVASAAEALALPVVLTHVYLLALVSLAIVLLALERWRPGRRRLFWLFAGAVAVMLTAQLPLTLAWPLPRGPWVLPAAAWSTLAPLAAMATLALVLAAERERRSGSAEAFPRRPLARAGDRDGG
jgi:hypothetical protein